MKVELYTAKPWEISRAHLLIPVHEKAWRAHFLQAWGNYWNIARPVEC